MERLQAAHPDRVGQVEDWGCHDDLRPVLLQYHEMVASYFLLALDDQQLQ
jgi:hypothetical protein